MPVIQILAVDDFPPWLHFVQQMFQSQTDFAIISTATDGQEAVDKAMQLRPDVILMDVGLRGMNGLQATRRIRALYPACKILFVSGDDSPDLIAAAFEAGALGYVWKQDSSLDLLTGIQAILRGQPFVSRSLTNWRELAE